MRMTSSTGHHQPSSPPPGPSSPEPLLGLRLLVLVTVSALAGVVVATLTWLAFGNPWLAVIAGLGSACGALERLHAWTGP